MSVPSEPPVSIRPARPGRGRTPSSTSAKVTGAISWTLLPRAIQVVFSMFTSILIVRSLGKFDYGTLSVLRTLLIVTVMFCGFGLGQAINRFVPELRVTGHRDAGRMLLFRSLLVQSVLWLLVSGALISVRPLLLANYPTYADLLILGVVLSLTEVAAGSVSQYAISSYRTRQMAYASVLGTMVLAGGTALLLHLGMRVAGVLIATAAGWAANTILLLLLLRKRAQSGPGPAAGTAALAFGTEGETILQGAHLPWNRLLAYSLPWIPNNFLNYVVWRQSETFLLGIYRDRIEAGLFDLAYKLPQLILEFLPTAVYPLVLAGFAETATVARERMPNVIATYYRLLFFVVAPLCVLGVAMGDVLLARMYGSDMAQAGPFCQAFFLVFTISFFGTPLSMTVYVIEKVWVNLVLNVAYAVVTLGLDLILIPRYGLIGAMIPTAFVTALTPVVRYYIARHYLPEVRIPWRFIGRCFLASAPLLGLFWAKAWADNLRGLGLVLLAAAAVTLVSYRLFRVLGQEERNFLRSSRIPARDWILKVL